MLSRHESLCTCVAADSVLTAHASSPGSFNVCRSGENVRFLCLTCQLSVHRMCLWLCPCACLTSEQSSRHESLLSAQSPCAHCS